MLSTISQQLLCYLLQRPKYCTSYVNTYVFRHHNPVSVCITISFTGGWHFMETLHQGQTALMLHSGRPQTNRWLQNPVKRALESRWQQTALSSTLFQLTRSHVATVVCLFVKCWKSSVTNIYSQLRMCLPCLNSVWCLQWRVLDTHWVLSDLNFPNNRATEQIPFLGKDCNHTCLT